MKGCACLSPGEIEFHKYLKELHITSKYDQKYFQLESDLYFDIHKKLKNIRFHFLASS